MPNDSESTPGQKAAPTRKARHFVLLLGVLMLVSAFPPFINAMGNPRIAALNGRDVIGLLASGACFGVGMVLLISRLISRGE